MTAPTRRRRRVKPLREQLLDRAAWISFCVVAWAVLRLIDAYHPLALTLGAAR